MVATTVPTISTLHESIQLLIEESVASLSGKGRVGANLQTEWFVDLQCRTTRSKLASLEHLLV